jgi:ABC-type branched-subunit amino acid transport system ATPase component
VSVTTAPVLECNEVSKSFSGVAAVESLSFSLGPAEILGVIGPNGSGKTTLLNCLSGILPVDRGEIAIGGAAATRATPEERARRGLARTFQTLRLFNSLSVRDNLRIGGHVSRRVSRARRERGIRARADAMLEMFGLEEDAGRVAGALPYGAQRRVEIARALMSEPLCLLLDEPAAGMNEYEATALRETLEQVRSHDVALIVVEHNTRFIGDLVDRAIVLDAGCRIAEGPPGEVLSDDRVVEAYFG